jgi:3-oxoacyl-[acyl-carrier protein] reductase
MAIDPSDILLTDRVAVVTGGTHAAAGWYHAPQTGDYRLGPSA